MNRYTSVFRCLNALRALGGRTWLSYRHHPSSVPLRATTIYDEFNAAVDRFPDMEAVVFVENSTRLTFSELKRDVDRLASGLLTIGVERGDRVGIWAPNVVEWVITQFAVAKIGAILVNVNPGYRVHEFEYCVRAVDMKCLIAASKFKSSNYYEMLLTLCPEIANANPGRLVSSTLPTLKNIVFLDSRPHGCAYTFEDVLNVGTRDADVKAENMSKVLQADDPINIQFTSGTTGKPKGATLSHHNLLNNAHFLGHRLGFHEQNHRLCLQNPLYHAFGNAMGTLNMVIYNVTCVFPAPWFNPEASLHAICQEKCSAIYGTPLMFHDMLSHPNFEQYDTRSLQTGAIAGSPCPRDLMTRIVNDLHVTQMTAAYGMTENSPVTFQTFRDDTFERQIDSIGVPQDHVEIKIVNANDEIVPIGEKGEICTRGYTTFLGYWNNPEATAEVITPDRWFHTGDIGWLDEAGYGHITGRIKDMIIRGGENIYPAEIEHYLHTHEKISDVYIIGVPDERMGEEVCAWVKLHDGQYMTAEEVKDFCKGEISHYKIPRYVKFVDEFPVTVTGKVQKFLMRKQAVKELHLEKAAKIFNV